MPNDLCQYVFFFNVQFFIFNLRATKNSFNSEMIVYSGHTFYSNCILTNLNNLIDPEK